ncbi:hypothetical protein BGW80DRAFT_1444002 [Lactifluus volemus]|nr:hypothetical protein BGW80DRAFT_1444002 [Lactifluus volemus]
MLSRFSSLLVYVVAGLVISAAATPMGPPRDYDDGYKTTSPQGSQSSYSPSTSSNYAASTPSPYAAKPYADMKYPEPSQSPKPYAEEKKAYSEKTPSAKPYAQEKPKYPEQTTSAKPYAQETTSAKPYAQETTSAKPYAQETTSAKPYAEEKQPEQTTSAKPSTQEKQPYPEQTTSAKPYSQEKQPEQTTSAKPYSQEKQPYPEQTTSAKPYAAKPDAGIPSMLEKSLLTPDYKSEPKKSGYKGDSGPYPGPNSPPNPYAASSDYAGSYGNDSQCDVGEQQCCDSTNYLEDSDTDFYNGPFGFILDSFTGDTLVGRNCRSIDALGSNCKAEPMCCNHNYNNGLIVVDCTKIPVIVF